MDPDECLREIRKQVDIYNTATDQQVIYAAAESVVELVEAMDEWLIKGGYLPVEWETH